MTTASWRITGEIVDACHCPVFCNNLVLREPLQPESGHNLQLPALQGQGSASAVRENPVGRCTSITIWTIAQGSYNGVNLDGLSAVALVQSPGPLYSSGGHKRALYLDAAAAPEQQTALEAVFSGNAGGYPRRLKQWTGLNLGVEWATIRHEQIGDRRRYIIPDILDLSVEPILAGASRQPFQLINPPFWKAPGENPSVGRCVHFRYQDHGLDWQLSGRSVCYSPFTYQA